MIMNKITVLNIGVVAAGRIGMIHAENILRIPGVQLKTVLDKYRRGAKLRKYNKEILITDDEKKFWEDPEITAVVIAASSSAHVNLIKKAVHYRKHIFCEKPVSFKSQELWKLSQWVKKHRLFFQVGFNRRFDHHFRRVKMAMEWEQIGKVYMIKIVNRDAFRPPYSFISKSGGLFFDFNSHDFDMIHYLTGEDIEEVYAYGANLIDPKIRKLGDVDTALISLKLKGGGLASIDCSRESGYGYDQRLEVFGSEGSAETGNLREDTVLLSRQRGISIAKPKNDFMIRYQDAYRTQIESFFNHLRLFLQKKKVNPEVTGFDAARAVAVSEAVMKSYRTGKAQKVIYPK